MNINFILLHIMFYMCAGVYPSFTINTDDFEPGPHTLVLELRVGSSTLRVGIYIFTIYMCVLAILIL